MAMNRSAKVLIALLAVALLFGLTLQLQAAGEDKTEGKIKSTTVSKNEFVLTDNNDKNWTFDMDPKCKVYVNDKDADIKDLKEGDHVFVTYFKQGTKLLATKITCKRK
jgi:hypothetical protein